MTTMSDLEAAWEAYRLAKVKADRPGTLEDGIAARRAWIKFSSLSDEYMMQGSSVASVKPLLVKMALFDGGKQ